MDTLHSELRVFGMGETSIHSVYIYRRNALNENIIILEEQFYFNFCLLYGVRMNTSSK